MISIQMIANGGSNNIRSYSDALKFKDRANASSVMIARSAMKNPSIFRADNSLEPIENLVSEYIKLSVRYDNVISLTKYTLQTMLSSGHYSSELLRRFHLAPDYQSLCDIFNMSEWYAKNKITASKGDYYDEPPEDEDLTALIKSKIEESTKSCDIDTFVLDSLHYDRRVFGESQSPKGLLVDYLNRLTVKDKDRGAPQRPQIEVIQLERAKKHQYYCSIIYDKAFYLNKSRTNSKKNAEQATAMLVCDKLGLIDLNDYRLRIKACNRNVG